jgi:hypothetical protein
MSTEITRDLLIDTMRQAYTRRGDVTERARLGAQADAILTLLAERDRQVAERAWDEGYNKGLSDGQRADGWCTSNPYRADSAAPARPTTDDRRWADKVADGCAEAARATLAARPTTPTPTVTEWGVRWNRTEDGSPEYLACDDRGEAEEMIHNNGEPWLPETNPTLVRRTVTPWTVADAPAADDERCGWCGITPTHDPGDCAVAQQAEAQRLCDEDRRYTEATDDEGGQDR